MPDVVRLTADYERWLGEHVEVVPEDLEEKHRELAADELRFLRGTYYLWLMSLPDKAFAGPEVPSVGDLHVENFGTWQDAEGIRRWGVNDLDELARGSYALDLIRLATSAVITPHLPLTAEQICDQLLTTWRGAAPGRAVDLTASRAHHLLALVPPEKSAKTYFTRLAAAASAAAPPAAVEAAALRSGPKGWAPSWHVRVAGTGSLGHPRRVAVTAKEAREAKVLGPPTAAWVRSLRDVPLPVHDDALLGRVHAALRGPEPLRRVDGWLVRRLAPDVVRIELAGLPAKDALRLLRSMGRAVVDVHGVEPAALSAAREHESGRRPDWLLRLVTTMTATTHDQWHQYRSAINGMRGGA